MAVSLDFQVPVTQIGKAMEFYERFKYIRYLNHTMIHEPTIYISYIGR